MPFAELSMATFIIQWQPSKLELATNEMVYQFFTKIEDDDWEELQLRRKSSPANFGLAKLLNDSLASILV
ncbi:hypothetical protein Sjap_004232 [Stephania japonica]|uniref:Uncharacterized protein n=1 Tax=Stephania japonica TaxID=461633 RepID=A0AAP0K2T1_9MAGN